MLVEMTSCLYCKNALVCGDPDLETFDWFDDTEALMCTSAHKYVGATSYKERQLEKEVPIPSWCPGPTLGNIQISMRLRENIETCWANKIKSKENV